MKHRFFLQFAMLLILLLSSSNMWGVLTNPVIKGDSITDPWFNTNPLPTGSVRMAYVNEEYPFLTLTDESIYTHYILAFAQLNETNNGIVLKSSSPLVELMKLKKRNPDITLILGIGRSSRNSFRAMAATEANRNSFALSCKSVMQQYGFDGIDIDWEWPTLENDSNEYNPKYESDKANYVKVVKKLREKLGRNKWISFYSISYAGYIDLPNMLRYANFVNVGGYNMDSVPDPIASRHHSALYPSEYSPKCCLDSAVNKHLEAGVSYSQMLIGIPYYARCAHVKKDDGNMYKGPNISNRDVHEYISELKYGWDEAAHVPYYYKTELVGYDVNNQPIYNNNLKITFDNERSIKDKVDYAKSKNLRGVFVWHYGIDFDDQRLGKALRDAYK